MRPRRSVFATEYIGETVECYKQCVERLGAIAPGDELLWARDVLQEFFQVTDAVPVLQSAENLFSAVRPLPQSHAKYVPYCRRENDVPEITIDDVGRLAKYRRSVRWFLDKPVDRTLIDKAIEIAAQSPSACNRQPFEFRIFDQKELVQNVARIPMGTAGYVESIPVFIVIVGQQRNFFAERDRHLIYIDGSLAAMSFVFAAEVQGLSTCCINWPDIEEKEREMAEAIGLEPDERPVMCLAVGYPDPTGMVAYSQKKSLSQIRFYNDIRNQA